MNVVTPITAAADADARLTFLHRAHARLMLFEAGEMDLAEAYDGLVCDIHCQCDREMVKRWERDFPHQRKANQPRRSTAQSTLDAVLYCVRQRGLAALKEPANIDRISRLSADDRARIDARIEKAISEKSN